LSTSETRRPATDGIAAETVGIDDLELVLGKVQDLASCAEEQLPLLVGVHGVETIALLFRHAGPALDLRYRLRSGSLLNEVQQDLGKQSQHGVLSRCKCGTQAPLADRDGALLSRRNHKLLRVAPLYASVLASKR